MDSDKWYASVEDLKQQDYDFFDKIILNLINKYKNTPDFRYWYAAVGDSCNGRLNENFISIGMIDEFNKISYSRIRIPKNELGERLIEKFVRSYLVCGIKEKNIVKNKGQNLNTIGYITTNDNKFFEIYTIQDELIINNGKINLQYYEESNKRFSGIELNDINDKIDHINDMLGLDTN